MQNAFLGKRKIVNKGSLQRQHAKANLTHEVAEAHSMSKEKRRNPDGLDVAVAGFGRKASCTSGDS